MSDNKYSKISDVEAPPAVDVSTPPEYSESDPILSVAAVGPAKTHFWKSLFAATFGFPVGLYFSLRTHLANRAGNVETARKNSTWAQKHFKWSVVLGLLMLVATGAFYIGFFVREVSVASHSFKEGLVSGIAEGTIAGETYAKGLVGNGNTTPVKLPQTIPTTTNPFDVRKDNPFWAQVILAFESHRGAEAAKPIGAQFGWTHGFKVGFCGVEGTDCTGVVLSNSTCPFAAVFGEVRTYFHNRRHRHHGRDEVEHNDNE